MVTGPRQCGMTILVRDWWVAAPTGQWTLKI